MELAAAVPWAKTARQIAEGMGDPDTLFRWPLARVLLVYFDGYGERKLSADEALAKVNAKRLAKGLPPLDRLPFQPGAVKHGR